MISYQKHDDYPLNDKPNTLAYSEPVLDNPVRQQGNEGQLDQLVAEIDRGRV